MHEMPIFRLTTFCCLLAFLIFGCETDPADVCRAVAAPGVYTGCNIVETSGWGCGEGERNNVVETTNARGQAVTLNVCCSYQKGCTVRVH